jgi:hypothetical protein
MTRFKASKPNFALRANLLCAALFLLAAVPIAAGSAMAQDKGTLKPEPLPPLAKADDP